jgi:hypothetical protein
VVTFCVGLGGPGHQAPPHPIVICFISRAHTHTQTHILDTKMCPRVGQWVRCPPVLPRGLQWTRTLLLAAHEARRVRGEPGFQRGVATDGCIYIPLWPKVATKVGATSQNTHHRQRPDILNEKRRRTVNICDKLLIFSGHLCKSSIRWTAYLG